MPSGIIILGAMGVGKTTLGRALAKQLNFNLIDVDDYLWHRDTVIPYTAYHTKEDRIKRMMNDISMHPHFIISGQMWSIRKAFEPLFDLGVFISAPSEIVVERFRSRELSLWGDRVLPGGDMYENFLAYVNLAKQYDTAEPPAVCLKRDEQWIAELPCPVLRIDGTKPTAENAKYVAEQYQSIQSIK